MLYADQTEKDHAEFVKGMRVKRTVRAPKERKVRRVPKRVRKAVAKKKAPARKAAVKKPARTRRTTKR
jgi:hypothetical protein